MQVRRQDPEIFIEGIDVRIKLDLGKHKELLAQTQEELLAYQDAVAHEGQRKRNYYHLIGKGRYDDNALRRSIEDMRINIRHLSDKVDAAKQKIEHHTLIVDTLTGQLEDYNRRYAAFNRQLQ